VLAACETVAAFAAIHGGVMTDKSGSITLKLTREQQEQVGDAGAEHRGA
jgi:hypothetical protein